MGEIDERLEYKLMVTLFLLSSLDEDKQSHNMIEVFMMESLLKFQLHFSALFDVNSGIDQKVMGNPLSTNPTK